MYKKIKDLITRQEDITVIQRTSDNAFIPKDKSNRDYQEYLKWVAKGNKAIEADKETE